MILFRALSIIAALGVAAGSTDSLRGLKKTPDGETPSVETICDGYQGKAFGICNAYCEAQDCDIQPQKHSCHVLHDKFFEIAGEEPPCPVCPCLATEEYYTAWVSTMQSMEDMARSAFLFISTFFGAHSLYVGRPRTRHAECWQVVY
jgi:hypothetical protein